MTIDPVSKNPASGPATAKNRFDKPEHSNHPTFTTDAAKGDSVDISRKTEGHKPKSNKQVEETHSKLKQHKDAGKEQPLPPSVRGSLSAYTAPPEPRKGSNIRISA